MLRTIIGIIGILFCCIIAHIVTCEELEGSLLFHKSEYQYFGQSYINEIISVEFKGKQVIIITKKKIKDITNTTSYPLNPEVEIYKTVLEFDNGWKVISEIKGKYVPEQTKVETTPERYEFPEESND